MASEERKNLDFQINEQNLKSARAAQDNQAETDQFKCGKCKQRKCKYYQLQTRSADEPMTTFVTCVNCGNRWKVLFLLNILTDSIACFVLVLLDCRTRLGEI